MQILGCTEGARLQVFPHITHESDISWKDILVVMDADHLLKIDFFQKCCAVMLDPHQAVCMTPQAFHNAIQPDFFDNENKCASTMHSIQCH